MSRPDNWKDLPVWECDNDMCEGYWVDRERLDPADPPLCPEHDCHKLGADDHAKYAGFTWGEAMDAENKFLCDIPIHHSLPVPEVVQLSTLPQELWMGLPVFHPFGQKGREGEIECEWFSYDVGVVVEVVPDPHFAQYGEWRVHFQGACGSGGWTLGYSPTNLWVPKVLADRLR